MFSGTIQISDKSPFPYLKPLDNVLLIGLNSVARYSAIKNPVGSNGSVDECSQRQLDRILSSGRFGRARSIVLVHHHFNKMSHRTDGSMQTVWKAFERQTMKLRGKKELMRLFARHRVDAVLHGHYHENREYTRQGVRFINGGGSVLGLEPSMLRLNILHVGAAGIRLERHDLPAPDETAAVRRPDQEDALPRTQAAA